MPPPFGFAIVTVPIHCDFYFVSGMLTAMPHWPMRRSPHQRLVFTDAIRAKTDPRPYPN